MTLAGPERVGTSMRLSSVAQHEQPEPLGPPERATPGTGRPLRCVHYLPDVRLDLGGVTRAVLDWCSILAARGHRMTLLAYDGRDVPRDWLVGGEGLPRAVLLDRPVFPRRLNRRSVERAREAIGAADVLHLHAPWLVGNRQLAAAALSRGVPYVVSIHGMLDDWSMARHALKKRLYLAALGRRFLRRAARVHCTAEVERVQASKWLGNARTVVLPYLCDLSPFHELPGPGPAREAFGALQRAGPTVLFLGRLHEKKGVDVLMRAIAGLRDQSLPAHLLVAGPGERGYVTSLHELARELRLEESVAFLGEVGGAAKVSLYQSVDVFVLPTHQENFGFALVEALACGTPVVTTRGVDIWRELESAGAIIVERSPEAVADAVRRVLSDPVAAGHRGAKGRRSVFEYLDPDRLSQAYEQLYADVAARR